MDLNKQKDDDLDLRWRTWLQERGSRLFLFARQQTRTESDAEDVYQNAMIKIWKARRKRCQEEEEPSMAEAFTAIRRCAIDLARKNIRRQARETKAYELSDDVIWFQDPVEASERTEMIMTAVKKLPMKYQEVITLKIWGELTFADIATTLGIPPNTAASRYRYGIDGLRKQLDPAKL